MVVVVVMTRYNLYFKRKKYFVLTNNSWGQSFFKSKKNFYSAAATQLNSHGHNKTKITQIY